MGRRTILVFLLALTAGLTISTIAQEHSKISPSPAMPLPARENATVSSATHTSDVAKAALDAATERALRLEGEKRFRTNCGRCHQPPHKFPPRMMAAAIRHMRVRAMITDEDMRLILRYMTQ